MTLLCIVIISPFKFHLMLLKINYFIENEVTIIIMAISIISDNLIGTCP